MNKIDVLYSTDNKYIDITMSSILSLIYNSNIPNIRVHIITAGFKRDDYTRITNFLSRFENVDVFFYPLENYNIEKYNIPNWRGLQTPNARLFFQDLLKTNIHSIENLLYLDGDTLVKGDLNSLDEYKNKTICACKDNCKVSYATNNGLPLYYNSGVLYINVEKWISNSLQDKIIEEVIHPSHDLYLPDQNILNYALKDDFSNLPINYNLMPLEYFFNGKEKKKYFNEKHRQRNYDEVIKAIENPKIYHSCCMVGIKPWTINNINPYNDDYRRFLFEFNPNFNLEELDNFRKFFNDNPLIFKKLLLLRNYLPDEFNTLINKISIHMQNVKRLNKKHT